MRMLRLTKTTVQMFKPLILYRRKFEGSPLFHNSEDPCCQKRLWLPLTLMASGSRRNMDQAAAFFHQSTLGMHRDTCESKRKSGCGKIIRQFLTVKTIPLPRKKGYIHGYNTTVITQHPNYTEQVVHGSLEQAWHPSPRL